MQCSLEKLYGFLLYCQLTCYGNFHCQCKCHRFLYQVSIVNVQLTLGIKRLDIVWSSKIFMTEIIELYRTELIINC